MPKIAIVHDYFTQRGGAERVAEQLYTMLPGSHIYSTVALEELLPAGIPADQMRTSWMQSLPKMKEYYRYYFPIYPLGVRSLDLSKYDLVITSSCSYAKGVHTRPDAIHVCYCHTPTRWIWRYQDYAEREKLGIGARAALPVVLKALRAWDRNAARQPDQFVANSSVVARRIESIYDRHAVIIPPPIDVDRFRPSPQQQDYFLVLSRLVAYKRIDLAIEACNLVKRQLKIVGSGPDLERLKKLAGPTVQFLGRLSDEETARYVSECQALLFPGEEDFGMVPLEVAAAGRPTIAFREGGATETIEDGVTGLLFDRQDVESLAAAIERFDTCRWSRFLLRSHAAQFDITVFRERFRQLLEALGVNLGANQFDAGRSLASAAIAG